MAEKCEATVSTALESVHSLSWTQCVYNIKQGRTLHKHCPGATRCRSLTSCSLEGTTHRERRTLKDCAPHHRSASACSSRWMAGPLAMAVVAGVVCVEDELGDAAEEVEDPEPLPSKVCFISTICLSSATLSLHALAIKRRCFFASSFCCDRRSRKTFLASARAAVSRAKVSMWSCGFTYTLRRPAVFKDAAASSPWPDSFGAMDCSCGHHWSWDK